jgi:adenylate cyclase
LEEKVPKEFFKDKVVLIGGSAAGLFDIVASPFDPGHPAVEVHANIIHNILKGNFLIPMSKWITAVTLFLIGLVTGVVSFKLPLSKGILTSSVLLLGYLIVSIHLFETKGIWLEIFSPSIVIMGVYTVVWSYRYLLEEQEKRQIRAIFSRYVSKEVVDELLSSPPRLRLGGERRVLTVLFSDIRGFTHLSDSLNPKDLVAILNEYLARMTKIVFKYKGTLNKFIGDALMIIYGAPIPQKDHARRAVLTALEMQEEIKKFEKERGILIEIRIGINTGEAVVGNIGSIERSEYTAIGNTVNVASRLESIAKIGQILITQSVYEEVKDMIEVKKLPPLEIKGVSGLIQLYEVIGLKNKAMIKG